MVHRLYNGLGIPAELLIKHHTTTRNRTARTESYIRV